MNVAIRQNTSKKSKDIAKNISVTPPKLYQIVYGINSEYFLVT